MLGALHPINPLKSWHKWPLTAANFFKAPSRRAMDSDTNMVEGNNTAVAIILKRKRAASLYASSGAG